MMLALTVVVMIMRMMAMPMVGALVWMIMFAMIDDDDVCRGGGDRDGVGDGGLDDDDEHDGDVDDSC